MQGGSVRGCWAVGRAAGRPCAAWPCACLYTGMKDSMYGCRIGARCLNIVRGGWAVGRTAGSRSPRASCRLLCSPDCVQVKACLPVHPSRCSACLTVCHSPQVGELLPLVRELEVRHLQRLLGGAPSSPQDWVDAFNASLAAAAGAIRCSLGPPSRCLAGPADGNVRRVVRSASGAALLQLLPLRSE
jgi:hypothetical protein